MERAKKDEADVLAPKTNGQNGTPPPLSRSGSLSLNKSSRARRESKENAGTGTSPPNSASARPVSSGSLSDTRTAAVANATKLPRPSPSRRPFTGPRSSRPLSVSDAYKMAEEEEEAVRGSPSPAPRPWRYRGGITENPMQKLLSQRPLNLVKKHSARRSTGGEKDDDVHSSGGSSASKSRRSLGSESDYDRKSGQFDEDQARGDGATPGKTGFFSKAAKVGPKVAEAGDELHRKASNKSLNGNSPRGWGVRGKPDPNWLKRAISSPEQQTGTAQSPTDAERDGQDVPVPSVEEGDHAAQETPAAALSRSPEKSFAWQIDTDFTAGDLQVSQSPPVKVATQDAEEHTESLQSRPRNTKLDEIKRLEIEAALKFPDEPVQPDSPEGGDSGVDAGDQGEGAHSGSGVPGRTNTKIEEIREREVESLSRRALASAKLNEIRERNAEYRSPSPEVGRKPSPEQAGESAPGIDDETPDPLHEKTVLEEEGEHIPNTPITIFRNPSTDKVAKPVINQPDDGEKEESRPPAEKLQLQRSSSGHFREDSRDLLRRLARVTSTSPTLELQIGKNAAANNNGNRKDGGGIKNELARSDSQSSRHARGEKARHPLGIVEPEGGAKLLPGSPRLRRISSTDSASTKRSSMAQSDGDPTDRIEAEMKLFAPLEAQSERGSIRAPSPPPDSDDDDEDGKDKEDVDVDETPRPKRVDPLSQPTPRVTGAYVETPATIKVERAVEAGKELFLKSALHKPDNQKKAEPQSSLFSSIADAAPFLRGRGQRTSRSVDGRADGGRKDTGRSTSVPSLRQSRSRSRSAARSRQPLVNSAKPPSVRDDLLEIQRRHQIEDSTLDDFDELLAAHDAKSSPEPEKVLKLESDDEKSDEDRKGEAAKQILDRERELETYDRMSKSLKTGLLGIQTAKKGIERLEDKVSHVDPAQKLRSRQPHHHHLDDDCKECVEHAHEPEKAVAYVRIPVPRLYYAEPRFRLSLLGLLVALLALWATTETAMCASFCRPVYCQEGQDCSWSPDDPFFGYALPVKLDQWTTGGRGREFASKALEEADDLLADLYDFLTGADIRAADTRYYSFEQKRQHRRRLRKKGIVKPWTEPPEQREKIEAWRRARLARERARDAREMGYDIGDGLGDESMAADEKVSSSRW